MKISLTSESIVERILISTNSLPVPLIKSQISTVVSNCLVASIKHGFIDIIDGNLKSGDISKICNTNELATNNVLLTLVSAGYLRKDNDDCFSLSSKWLNSQLECALLKNIEFQEVISKYFDRNFDHFVQGKSYPSFHDDISRDEMIIYHLAMREIASLCADELTNIHDIPHSFKAMLDIGGSHGIYSCSFYRSFPHLDVTVLELKDVVDLYKKEPMLKGAIENKDVKYLAGDALKFDYGVEKWNVILLANVIHHFSESENKSLFRKLFNSMQDGGVLIVVDMFKSSNKLTQHAITMEMVYSFLSSSSVWSIEEVQGWLKDNTFHCKKIKWLHSFIGVGVISAIKKPNL